MYTFTYIIIYLSICAVVIMVIPAARNQWKEFVRSIPQRYKDIDLHTLSDTLFSDKIKYPNLKKWLRKIAATIIFVFIGILFFILTPLILPFLIKSDMKRIEYEKAERNTNSNKEVNKNLFFWKMGGAGNVLCLNCGCTEDIVSFIHGINTSSTGLQCQLCGQFHSVSNWEGSDEVLCECGGVLEREKPIFCPECKSKNMRYDIKYIT